MSDLKPSSPAVALRDALARDLYAMFGNQLYGQDIGPWDSHRVEAEHARWLTKADYLIDSAWLAEHDRAVAEQAWDEATGCDGFRTHPEPASHSLYRTPTNPYRKATS